jgi:hypothetical protein
MKQCATCKDYKIEREFQRDRTTPDTYDYSCKACNRIKDKAYWASEKGKEINRKKSRKYEMKKNYGITPDQFDAMLAKQDYGCGICGITKVTSKLGNFHIDHNRKTGKVRGLLCPQCNTAIGLLKETPDLFHKALSYLVEHNSPKNTQLEAV